MEKKKRLCWFRGLFKQKTWERASVLGGLGSELAELDMFTLMIVLDAIGLRRKPGCSAETPAEKCGIAESRSVRDLRYRKPRVFQEPLCLQQTALPDKLVGWQTEHLTAHSCQVRR